MGKARYCFINNRGGGLGRVILSTIMRESLVIGVNAGAAPKWIDYGINYKEKNWQIANINIVKQYVLKIWK